jgi:hypothetical protein
MQLPIILALGLGLLALVVALILLARKARTSRTEALQHASLTLGFAFEAEGDVEQMKALGDLPLYSHGHSKRMRNVMIGRAGREEARIFDYHYTTGGGNHSHTWRQTVALYPGGGRGLPDFLLAPENVFHKIGQAFGYRDIDFDSSPAFSSRYLLRGPDEMAIRSAFTIETRTFLEQEQGWTIEVRAGNVGIYRAGKRCKPEEVAGFLEQSHAVLRALTRR